MRQQISPANMTQMLRFVASCNGTEDGVLLARFVQSGDEAAFNALLRRYGEMVWGVCRRIACTQQDAEDAFQAVFIVLLRRAGTLQLGRPLGAWLYGVAVRVSRAGRSAARRRSMASLPAEDLLPAGKTANTLRDWLPFVDLEVQRLPERYRGPFILCEVEGRSRREAASLLGVPEGTLSSRLATAKKRLARRLSCRGLGLPAAGLSALATGLETRAAPASLHHLAASAAQQVLRAPGAWHALLPPSVVTLTRGVTLSMFSTTWKVISLGVVALGLAGGGLALGLASAASGLARAANDIPAAFAAPTADAPSLGERTPAPAPADDEAIQAWLQANRDRMLKDGKDTTRIDRWLAEVRRGMQQADRKSSPDSGGVSRGAGAKNNADTADYYKGVYGQDRGPANRYPTMPPGVPADATTAQGGLFIPTADGGWMNVGERILSLEKELKETRRQLNELKKTLEK